MKNTHIILHSAHFASNIALIRSWYSKPCELCLAVKSNGYGHGLAEIAELAVQNDIRSFSVANTDEAAQLRHYGIDGSIYLCSLPAKEEIPALVELGVVTLLSDVEFIALFHEEAARQKRTHRVHIKVDTGMGRLGCSPQDVPLLYEDIVRSSWLRYGGIATHLSSADIDKEFTVDQLRKFESALDELRKRNVDLGLVHAANSAGFFRFASAQFNMIRIGLAAYGYAPYQDSAFSSLRPVMEFCSQIAYVKRVAPGTPISYQYRYRSKEECNIATVTTGYGYGINRLLSNRGKVLIGEKTYPIVGLICMDHLMVNLGDDSFEKFTPVTIFGPDPRGPSAKSVADEIGTISYEVMCATSSLVPRTVR